MNNPCEKCVAPKRHYACHDECPERKEWLSLNDKIRENRRSEERIDGTIRRIVCDTKIKMQSRGMKWGGKEQ